MWRLVVPRSARVVSREPSRCYAWCQPGAKGCHWLVNGVVAFGLPWALVASGVRSGASSLESAVLEELSDEELIIAWCVAVSWVTVLLDGLTIAEGRMWSLLLPELGLSMLPASASTLYGPFITAAIGRGF